MARFRISILIIGLLIIAVAASLLTVLALYVTGAVVTERIELIYTVLDVKKEYDGSPLFPEEYELTYGELLNGHYAVVEFTGSQTDAGQSRSGLSVKICDERGYDVTSEYKIGVTGGLLNVEPRKISVVLNDEEVTYNGSKVSFENYTITEGELVAGHKIAGSQNVQLISVNDVLPDDLNVLVFDVTGKNVTKNYNVNFSYNENRIRVVPRPLTVKPVDIIKTYDGVEVDLNSVEILAGSLVEGQYFKHVEINGGNERLVDVCDKVIRIKGIEIYQRVGSSEVAVTENYDLDLSETGIVRINPRKLTITARSQNWEYDGTDHYLNIDEYPPICEGFVQGEGIASAEYFGSIKNVGDVDNKVTNIRFAANTSWENYDITTVAGTLTVSRREVTVITPTVSRTYDGQPLFGASENESPHGLNLAPDHVIWYDTENLPKQITCGTIINDINFKIIDSNDKDAIKTDLSENYKITPVYGTITVTKRAARISTRTVTKVFDGETLYGFDSADDIDTYNILSDHTLLLPTGNRVPQITNIDKKSNSFSVTIMDGETDVTENYDIDYQFGYLEITRLNITVRTAGETKEYDGEPLQLGEEFTEIEGLPDNDALMVVLADGKEYISLDKVGRVKNEVIYTLNYNGVPVDKNNYKIEHSYGYLEITPCELYLNLKNYNEIFNDKEIEIDKEEALEGNNLKPFLSLDNFEIKPSQSEIKNAGSYSYTVELKDCGELSNFNLRISGGSITIAKCEVEVKLKDLTDLEYKREAYTINPEEVISYIGVYGSDTSHLSISSFRIVTSGTLKNVGEYTYTVKFQDSSYDRNHELYITEGEVVINPFEVFITLADKDDEKYDGTSHLPTVEDAIVGGNLSDAKLSKSEFAVIALNGDPVNAREDSYLYTVQMVNSREAENFTIIINGGSIKIGKSEVNLTLSDYADITYNSKLHTPSIDAAIASGKPDHLKYSAFELVVMEGDMKSVGTHTYTVVFRNSADEDNHVLTITNENEVGKVKIVKCEVSIELLYYSEEYTGEVHELSFDNLVGDVSSSDPEFIKGANLDRYFELYCSETIKDARSYTYGIRFIYRDDYDNIELNLSYRDTANGAKFEIKKIQVDLVNSGFAGSPKTYDGKVYTLVADGYLSLSKQLSLVGTISATGVSDSATVGIYPISFDGSNVRIFSIYGENISGNFEIENGVTVNVTINQRDITFTLDNYFGTTKPSAYGSEVRKCLGISSSTPLLAGYSVNFEDVNIRYRDDTTLIVDDFDSVIIYNEEGDDATENFHITNEDPVTSSVIII